MNKKILVSVVAVIIVMGTGGCTMYQTPTPPTPIINPVENLTPPSVPTSQPPTTTPAPAQIPKNISQAHNAFGFNAFKLLTQEDNKNVFISPSSIALALSMVYNGAREETKTAMEKTLQFQNLNIATINQESLGLINRLKNPDEKVELSIANSVWARKGVTINTDFLNNTKTYFNAEISPLDFSNPTAADTINAWVSNNTKGKIPTIVSPPIDPAMMMYLINAVYFKGSWSPYEEFDKKLTKDKTFTTAQGASEQRPFMQRQGDMRYLETDNFQSVKLDYGKNRYLSMYIFLPKSGSWLKSGNTLGDFIKTLDAPTWNEWMKQYETAEGTLLLPKFKMEYEQGLIPMLTNLGMGVAFKNNANFTGISDGLKIGEIKHKTYIDVNEEGTEAAAVTSIGMMTSSAMIPVEIKKFTMNVNHPFFIAIRDNQTQEILFMGAIQNP